MASRSIHQKIRTFREEEKEEKRRRKEDPYPDTLEQAEEGNTVYEAMGRPHLPPRGWHSPSGQKQANGKLQYRVTNDTRS